MQSVNVSVASIANDPPVTVTYPPVAVIVTPGLRISRASTPERLRLGEPFEADRTRLVSSVSEVGNWLKEP